MGARATFPSRVLRSRSIRAFFLTGPPRLRGTATLTPRLLIAYSGKARDASFALDSASLEPDIGNLFDRTGYSGLDPLETGCAAA